MVPLPLPFLVLLAPTTDFAALEARARQGEPALEASLQALIRERRGTPLVEGSSAVFVVSGDPTFPPRVIGDWNNWAKDEAGLEASRLERLGHTRFFFRRVTLDPAARVEYLVATPQGETLDPLNPRRVGSFGGEAHSELRMPGYLAPPETLEHPRGRRGRVLSFEHESATLGNSRRVHVYLPEAYHAEPQRRFPLAVFKDGTTYVDEIHVPRILDNLIAAGRVEPMVAAFVDPVDRRSEYGVHPGYRAMISDELLPRLARDYRLEQRPERRLVAGGSRGGQAALDLALARPDVFGLCGAWAPAIAPREVADFLDGRRTSGRFVLIQARYDARWGLDAPALRDGLERLGARVVYRAVPEGHALATWAGRVGEVLVELFPGAGPAR